MGQPRHQRRVLADGALKTQPNVNNTVATYSYDNARRLLDLWNKTSLTATDAITRHQFTLDAGWQPTQGRRDARLRLSAAVLGARPAACQQPTSTPRRPRRRQAACRPLISTQARHQRRPAGLPNRPGPSTGPDNPDVGLRLRQPLPPDVGLWRPGWLDDLQLRSARQPPDQGPQ